jgi:hypothetical protein
MKVYQKVRQRSAEIFREEEESGSDDKTPPVSAAERQHEISMCPVFRTHWLHNQFITGMTEELSCE